MVLRSDGVASAGGVKGLRSASALAAASRIRRPMLLAHARISARRAVISGDETPGRIISGMTWSANSRRSAPVAPRGGTKGLPSWSARRAASRISCCTGVRIVASAGKLRTRRGPDGGGGAPAPAMVAALVLAEAGVPSTLSADGRVGRGWRAGRRLAGGCSPTAEGYGCLNKPSASKRSIVLGSRLGSRLNKGCVIAAWRGLVLVLVGIVLPSAPPGCCPGRARRLGAWLDVRSGA